MTNTQLAMVGAAAVAVGAGVTYVAIQPADSQCVMRLETGLPEGCLRKDLTTGQFTWESTNVIFPASESSGDECVPAPCPTSVQP